MRLSLYTIRTQMKSGKYAFPNSISEIDELLYFCAEMPNICAKQGFLQGGHKPCWSTYREYAIL